MASESKAEPAGSPYVRLLSAEKHVFVLEKKVAMNSGVIKAMLSSDGFVESRSGEISFDDISTVVLERVIQYLHYKAKHSNSKVPIPEFPVPPEQALDLLLAANYLDC